MTCFHVSVIRSAPLASPRTHWLAYAKRICLPYSVVKQGLSARKSVLDHNALFQNDKAAARMAAS